MTRASLLLASERDDAAAFITKYINGIHIGFSVIVCYDYYHYYTVCTHVMSFTEVKNRKCGHVTCHCRNARLYRTDL